LTNTRIKGIDTSMRQSSFQNFESRKFRSEYGGELLRTRKGRSHSRPLATKNTMHLVLRSSKARKEWSFLKKKNAHEIQRLSKKFANKYGVRILSLATVGNHLHFHLRLTNRHTYTAFVRALTGALAMAITGRSRWNHRKEKLKFWDYRPFSRIVIGRRAFLNLRDYIQINALEGFGYTRRKSRFLVAWDRARLIGTG
jgi:REP element-mobilizing transposase RayT